MEFFKIAKLLSSIEENRGRIEKIIILRDFLIQNPKEAPIIFDLISGNYQRKIEKRKLGISIQTIFSVLSSISSFNETYIETLFNKKGDIGLITEEILSLKKQSNLLAKKLTLKQILDAFEKIAKTKGTNSNKRKKEILSELYYSVVEKIEYKYLSRLLIDDLRIGVSEGVLKEASCCALFASIKDIKQTQKENKKNIKTDKIYIEEFIELDSQFQLESHKSREIYNSLLLNFEKKYNILISFEKIIQELKENKNNLFRYEINLGEPFKSMLGPRSNSIDEAFELTNKPALIDFKYDGLRVQIHNNKGKVVLYTRNLDNITKQFPEIVEHIKNNFSDLSFVLDSECVGYNFDRKKFLPFQLLSRRILTKEVKTVSHINVVVRTFDILYLNGKTLSKEPYKTRREILEKIYLNRKLVQKHKIKI